VAQAIEIKAPIRAADPQEWLAAVLRTRFNEVISNRGSALNESQVEGIHDMRVSIRRLRSVIRDFADIADKFPLKTLRKDLGKLADALGKVRDLDVAIQALERLAAKTRDPDISAGVLDIVRKFRKRRSEEFDALRPHLLPAAVERLSHRFEKALNTSLGQRSLFGAATLEDAQGEILQKRVEDFHKLADSLFDPHQVRRHHKLRIAAKHLRYAAELFALGEETDLPAAAKEIAAMQSYLGEVHDCDVWIVDLKRGLTSTKRRSLVNSERHAAIWLMSQFVRRRSKAFRSALELYDQWQVNDFLHRLVGDGQPAIETTGVPEPNRIET